MNNLGKKTKDSEEIVITSLDQLETIELPDTSIKHSDINTNLETAGADIAWLLGAFIRRGRKTSPTSGHVPLPLPPPYSGRKYFTLTNALDLGFSKELSIGRGISWVEDKNLQHEFLKGFITNLDQSEKDNTYREQLGVNIPFILKWMLRHGFEASSPTPSTLTWVPNLPLHYIPNDLKPGKYWIGKKLRAKLNPTEDFEIDCKFNKIKYIIIPKL